MGTNILDLLVKKNEFPIIFIGSGVPKRYLVNYPSWEELLKEIWNFCGNTSDFYAHLNKLKQEFSKNNSQHIDFEVYLRVATELEETINVLFYKEKIEIDGLTQKDAYKNDFSPFKKLLSNKFNSYY